MVPGRFLERECRTAQGMVYMVDRFVFEVSIDGRIINDDHAATSSLP
ncbi:hypothetical protein CEV32_0251 [Brucella rhizosphaerae]|uniref:Uncharacterized protein n=1 Tax=Brucella rhizosphaerae TaxID=571254 RepID=A0A256FHE5_9HYPH|nr:hypothetical protein CEV32_0251 [Brucella rhizosphaerae]